MSGNQATALGVVGAALAFFIAGASASDIHLPAILILILGSVNAGITFALGNSNPGTSAAELHTAARVADVKESAPPPKVTP